MLWQKQWEKQGFQAEKRLCGQEIGETKTDGGAVQSSLFLGDCRTLERHGYGVHRGHFAKRPPARMIYLGCSIVPRFIGKKN